MKNILKKICKLFLRILGRFLPIKKNTILFTSFGGHYSDSPKYISMELNELAPYINQIWLIEKPQNVHTPSYIKKIDIDSLRAVIYRSTAKIIIDNVYGGKANLLLTNSFLSRIKFNFVNFLNNKKSQKVYTTWHGTPIKKMGRDQIGNQVIKFSCPQTTMVLGNKYTCGIMRHLTFNSMTIKLIGTPRNDILFNIDDNRKKSLKKKLGLPINKKIILFAPTFRNDGKDVEEKNLYRSGIEQLSLINFNILFKSLKLKFGGDWILVLRFHYHVEQMVDWNELALKTDGKVINGNKQDDMMEYLVCTDVLITDASSCMFDFCITKKPCFIFFPDLKNYQNKERGFYKDIDTLPFNVSISFDELLDSIDNFNFKLYSAKIEKMIEQFGYVDDNESSKRVVSFILENNNFI